MSVASAVLSSLAYSTAVVAPPAAAVVVANKTGAVPPDAGMAMYVIGAITFVCVFLANIGKAQPVMQALLGIKPDKPAVPRPDHPLPVPYGSQCVTHQELDARMERLEEKVDDNTKDARRELKDLAATMQACVLDMTNAVARIQGQLDASKPAHRPR